MAYHRVARSDVNERTTTVQVICCWETTILAADRVAIRQEEHVNVTTSQDPMSHRRDMVVRLNINIWEK